VTYLRSGGTSAQAQPAAVDLTAAANALSKIRTVCSPQCPSLLVCCLDSLHCGESIDRKPCQQGQTLVGVLQYAIETNGAQFADHDACRWRMCGRSDRFLHRRELVVDERSIPQTEERGLSRWYGLVLFGHQWLGRAFAWSNRRMVDQWK
jgi:hypothetical protein